MLTTYNAKEIEKKWQDWWEAEKIYWFDMNSEKPYYSIDNPPRYASGALHMGHATHYTHIDFVARYKRLCNYNVFFPLCFDVNGTPIEVNVEKKHGITKKSISREEFIKLCSEFAESNIAEMKRQFKILGESMDPSIYYQTDAPYYRRLTQISFIRLFKQNLVYKGTAPVNWCPRCETALADAEVEYRERKTLLNYIKFRDENGNFVVIATTRPELLCTCQLVAVHPEDEKNNYLAGKSLYTPIYNKKVSVVADEKVDPNFGSGVVMICTIGDKDDIEWVYKYNLPIEMGIDREGKMTAIAGKYMGMSVVEARKAIIEDLKQEGLLVKQEEIIQNVGTCWRCHTPIEFLSLPQWYLKILPFKEKVLEAVEKIVWHPEFMKVRLIDWVNSLKWDWVISRQRYFATPIPVWECTQCGFAVVAEEEQCYVDPTIDKPPVEKCPKCGGNLKGSEEVFDTWMDSSISPLFITRYGRDERFFRRAYPVSIRPQGKDIVRTWLYYTILRCYQLTGKMPFKHVWISGTGLDERGEKMSKSKGNVIDPIPIIERYGADRFRFWCAQESSLGEDFRISEERIANAGKFITKLMNIARYVSCFPRPRRARLTATDKWILAELSLTARRCLEGYRDFNFFIPATALKNFAWNIFADHYIEMSKQRAYGRGFSKEEQRAAWLTLHEVLKTILLLLAPIIPFFTDYVWRRLYSRRSIHRERFPRPRWSVGYAGYTEDLIRFNSMVWRMKKERGLSLKDPIKVEIPRRLKPFEGDLVAMHNIVQE